MKILETRIFYSDEQISKIVVLADYTSVGKPFSDVRAIMVTNKPCGGYEFIKPDETLTNELIERTADYGMEVSPDEFFPNWSKIYNSRKTV